MATHGEPAGDQNEPMQDDGERMEEAETGVLQNRFWSLDVAESELSSDFDSEEEEPHSIEDPSEEEVQEQENDENDENAYSNNNAVVIAVRAENRQGRQVLRIRPQAFVDENSRGFIYDDNFHNLYPHLFLAITTIRGQFILEGKEWFQEVEVSPEVLPLFEDSVQHLIGMPRPTGPFETPEQEAVLDDYIDQRKNLLIEAAEEYHEANDSRPGCEHKLGYLFPPKTSFDMIEYFRVAFKLLEHPLPMITSEVAYPELDEYNPQTRMLIEQCISNHKTTEMREEIIEFVESRTVLSKNNRATLNNLIDEMNFMFNRNLEHNIIRKAREDRKKRRKDMPAEVPVQHKQPRRMEAREVEHVPEVDAEAKRVQEQADAWVADNLQNNIVTDQSTRYVYDQEPSTSSSPTYIDL